LSVLLPLQPRFGFSALTPGVDDAAGKSSPYHVPGPARNEFPTPRIYIFESSASPSFRFGERYKLSLVAEAFNLFNRSNLATVNTGRYGIASSSAVVLTNPAASTPFGGPRTFLGERQIQLAAKFIF
jgi:hypothetical protein